MGLKDILKAKLHGSDTAKPDGKTKDAAYRMGVVLAEIRKLPSDVSLEALVETTAQAHQTNITGWDESQRAAWSATIGSVARQTRDLLKAVRSLAQMSSDIDRKRNKGTLDVEVATAWQNAWALCKESEKPVVKELIDAAAIATEMVGKQHPSQVGAIAA